ncbi:uncharacterized protein Z520_06199 [Fonsecaea multimorphosa CBS 102226]|uniref:DUF6536 domain-containing protein n=1 Tax=Fonsecaea multimorphosa CBS 102226 TaxID=1442371 RepID=A0A0D2K4M0_9EURO|nr:uncharacterized protein Z520_06199 [Fonsecaea multimorphosa CBS 102226]KIX98119.1 hypothetical protein Z520_06199 [Fonsecaea multimorphosa CBS 102226]OAL24194.1 hypothetical protein AYO22_05854 [Fonsecaea multimorphosa]
MDFLEPRRAYTRAHTEDIELSSPDVYLEQHSLGSKSSFTTTFSSTIKDESPLLDADSRPGRKGFYISGKSLKLPFFVWPTRLYGWRTGALTAALLGAISLLINLVVVSWLAARGHGSSLVEIYNGHCGKVESLDIWIHLAINTLSTLLLGGSNYCMQCLSAPSREDVDRAHARGEYLDVGVPSVRNLRRIARRKVILWWALGLSSIPLHLMYNSAFYKSLETNDYNLYFVTQDFVDGKPFVPWDGYSDLPDQNDIQSSLLTDPDTWERLDNDACIRAYATEFLTSRRNLVLLSNNSTKKANESVLEVADYGSGDVDAFDWICNSDTNIASKVDVPYGPDGNTRPCETWVSKVEAIATRWQPYNFDVEYCLSERVSERCSYNGNIPIIATVLVCNAIKIVGMLFVAFRLEDNPLITVGDAVESFLNENDKSTEGFCLLSKSDVVMGMQSKSHWSLRARGGDVQSRAKVARLRTKIGLQAASLTRWSSTVGFLVLALIVVAVFLAIAVKAIHLDGFDIGAIGFGKVTQAAVISGWQVGATGSASSKILSAILIANLPQTIFSFLYLNLNGVLTSMWLASEWSNFATQRKTLRVSRPKGAQRSTHFLQLPYKAAVPLMVLSGALHWLISQSIFLAVVAEYNADGTLYDPIFIASCGFSPLAMIVVLVLGGVLVVATLGLGNMMRYDPSIPLVGSCSAAIAAACHQPNWDTDASLKAVQWGVIPGMADGDGVGHCAFSSGDVEPVREGRAYTGITDDKQSLKSVEGHNNAKRRARRHVVSD